MSNDFDTTLLYDVLPNASDTPPAFTDHQDEVKHLEAVELGVPQYVDRLTDGTEIGVIGDAAAFADYNHKQGDNDQNCKGDCGLVSTADVLNQFGVHVTENDVVHHAIEHGECDTHSTDAAARGQSTVEGIVQIMHDYGVPAHVEKDKDLDSLVEHIQHGQSVIIASNSGYLWNDPHNIGDGSADHAVTVTGVAYDPQNGTVTGFFINDSGDGNSAKFVPAAQMQQAWVNAGGQCVVSDAAHPDAAQPSDAARHAPSDAARPAAPGPMPAPAAPASSNTGQDSGSGMGMALAGLTLAGISLKNLNRPGLIKKR